MDGYLSEVRAWAGNAGPPVNWAYCRDQLLAINEYTALFSLMGPTYGGDGRSAFGLPNLFLPAGAGENLGEFGSVYTGGSGSAQALGLNFIICLDGYYPELTGEDSTGTSAVDGMVGEIRIWSGTGPPENWEFCLGQTMDTTAHPELFDLIGSTFSDGSAFALPNLNKGIPVGVDTDHSLGQTDPEQFSEEFVTGSTGVTGITPMTYIICTKGQRPLSALDGTLGEIRLWPAISPPGNWSFCRGQSLNSTTNAELFKVLGTTYGGGGGNFNLPDLAGRVMAGVGEAGGTVPTEPGQVLTLTSGSDVDLNLVGLNPIICTSGQAPTLQS